MKLDENIKNIYFVFNIADNMTVLCLLTEVVKWCRVTAQKAGFENGTEVEEAQLVF